MHDERKIAQAIGCSYSITHFSHESWAPKAAVLKRAFEKTPFGDRMYRYTSPEVAMEHIKILLDKMMVFPAGLPHASGEALSLSVSCARGSLSIDSKVHTFEMGPRA